MFAGACIVVDVQSGVGGGGARVRVRLGPDVVVMRYCGLFVVAVWVRGGLCVYCCGCGCVDV